MTSQLPLNPHIRELKDLIREKGEIVTEPKNGAVAIIIKDHCNARGGVMGNQYEIAVGKAMSFPKYFDVVGYEKKGDQFPFSEGSLRTQIAEIRTPKSGGQEILLATFPIQFMRTVDETRWENKLNELPDLIALLANL